MKDLLPQAVLDEIGRQYRSAVEMASHDFEDFAADEDSVTGALGQTMKNVVKGTITIGGREFGWSTTARKLRGRGANAPEKKIGADALVELEVWDTDGTMAGQKLVAIQTKTEWTGKDRLLPGQAKKLSKLSGGGIVVDFREGDYRAVEANVVARAKGDRRNVPDEKVRPFGDVLAGDFLECLVGSRDTYFDAEREILVEPGLRARPFTAKRRVLTKVSRR